MATRPDSFLRSLPVTSSVATGNLELSAVRVRAESDLGKLPGELSGTVALSTVGGRETAGCASDTVLNKTALSEAALTRTKTENVRRSERMDGAAFLSCGWDRGPEQPKKMGNEIVLHRLRPVKPNFPLCR